uniref:Dual oxidase maturation factor 1 n=1 Tax=Panagrolaimus davidi TaxID=227884 RepID=A0A914Q4S7_9BILA
MKTVALALPYWNVGSNVIVSQFRAYSDLRHEARLGVSVGLTGFNVSLNYIKTLNSEDPYMYKGMYFNERYTMDGVTEMQEELQGAYDQGLPYPFLKVLEYFSVNAGSFCWGREYRKAGYYTDALLWFSFSLWLLQCILLFLLPHQYSKVGLLTGCFILLGVLIYVILGPNQLHIPFIGSDGQKILITMRYGCCFYLAIAAGIFSIIHSFTLCVLQYFRLYALDTILSSKLDEDVSPKCRWGNRTKKDVVLHNIKKK